MIDKKINIVLAQINAILEKAKKNKNNNNNTITNITFDFNYNPQDIEKSKEIIYDFFSGVKGKFKVRKNVEKTLFEWLKQPDNYYIDFKNIAKSLTNLCNGNIANNTDTTIDGCDKAHKGYRHFHTNGQPKCEYSIVYYKNKNSGNIHLIAIDTHKDLKIKKNKAYPNVSTLD